MQSRQHRIFPLACSIRSSAFRSEILCSKLSRSACQSDGIIIEADVGHDSTADANILTGLDIAVEVEMVGLGGVRGCSFLDSVRDGEISSAAASPVGSGFGFLAGRRCAISTVDPGTSPSLVSLFFQWTSGLTEQHRPYNPVSHCIIPISRVEKATGEHLPSHLRDINERVPSNLFAIASHKLISAIAMTSKLGWYILSDSLKS